MSYCSEERNRKGNKIQKHLVIKKKNQQDRWLLVSDNWGRCWHKWGEGRHTHMASRFLSDHRMMVVPPDKIMAQVTPYIPS